MCLPIIPPCMLSMLCLWLVPLVSFHPVSGGRTLPKLSAFSERS